MAKVKITGAAREQSNDLQRLKYCSICQKVRKNESGDPSTVNSFVTTQYSGRDFDFDDNIATNTVRPKCVPVALPESEIVLVRNI